MTAMLTALGVSLIGVGSFLLHDRRRGYLFFARAAEVVGGLSLGVSWLVGAIAGPVDCYDPGANCPTTWPGFVWYVLRPGVTEATFAALAWVAGWGLAKLTPSHGQQDYSGVDGVFGNLNPSPPMVLAPRPSQPAAPRPQPAVVRTWVRITLNDRIAHLLGPNGRSACGRLLTGHRLAEPHTPLCQRCARRSSVLAAEATS